MAPEQEAYIGKPKNAVDTPALLLDVERLERNLARMAEFFAPLPCQLRPHAKTHKCVEIARRQIAHGAIGITCAKLSEAEVMARGGIEDILVANQVVGRAKVERAARLARRCRLTVAVDAAANVRELAEAARAHRARLGVLVEVNVGMDRCGVEGPEEAVALAQEVVRKRELELRGLMGYEGHAVFIEDAAARREAAEQAMARLLAVCDAMVRAGLPVPVVSAGGTGTYDITGRIPGITEIQCGSYCVMDARYRRLVPEFECALTALTTVISRPTRERLVLDIGRKSVGSDFGMPEPCGRSDFEVVGLAEEHGKARVLADAPLAPGQKVELLPGHCCTTIALHDWFYVVRGGIVEAVWPIQARGKFQ